MQIERIIGLGLVGLVSFGCGDPADPEGEADGAAGSESQGDAAGDDGPAMTDDDGPLDAGDDGNDDGDDDGTGGDDTGPGDDGAGSSEGSDDTGEPGEPALPTPTGTCPTLAAGDVVFSPAGLTPRSVRLWMSSEAETLDGPLVFYWHGTGSSTLEASYGLTDPIIAEITAMGGIVAAPSSDPASGTWPWYLVSGMQDNDLRVADEVVGCIDQQVGIDARRIHSIGMSAGGIQTTAMSFYRSSYIASVVTYSGGFVGTAPPNQDPNNKFAAMIFHGGPGDIVGISFQDAGEMYRDALQAAGHFAFICNHGGGHTIPLAQSSVWQFFSDHPYGTNPSPYEGGLPAGFPAYCQL